MSLLFYNIFLLLYRFGISVASLFNPKARLWIRGRKDIFKRLAASVAGQQPVIWIHVSSLGEFEQGRPVLEHLKTAYPGHKLLLTFFSPSGYEVRKNYTVADWVFYLPLDGPLHARRFLDIVQPSLAVFVKYDFWYHYLHNAKKRGIPVLLVSAIFRPDQPFFSWYGGLHRRMLHSFRHIFVQDSASQKLLQEKAGYDSVSIGGDTRFDRVAEIAGRFEPIPVVESFSKNAAVLVAGSTWPADEAVIAKALQHIPSLKLVIAPHTIDAGHLEQVRTTFPDAVFFSAIQQQPEQAAAARVLVIDNIGMLSKLYRYALITYVGGGFTTGIHNILEAVVYGKPVLFGPVYQKFKEARDLIEKKSAFPIKTGEELQEKIDWLLNNPEALERSSQVAGEYVAGSTGATQRVLDYIREKRLLNE